MNEKAVYEIVLRNQKFNDGLKDTETKLNSFESSLKDIQNKIVSAFAVGSLISFGNEAYKTSTQLQSLRNSIVFASGSAKEGAENLKFLTDISSRMGLNLMATTEGFRTFSGALIGSKFEGQKARDIFEKISTGISVMGLSADDAKGAFLALGQMVSKGTVSAEELRGQLGERLPGAFQIAARSLGVTTKNLGDMLKAGEVITEDFLPKFADEIEKTFKGGLTKAAQSQAADMAKIENKWLNFKDLIGKGLAPTIHQFAYEEKALSQQFEDQKIKVSGLEKNMAPLIERYKHLKEFATLNKDEQKELHDIIQTIGAQMPSAVSAWNSYGEAIDINTGKLEKNITANRDALRLINAQAIKEKEGELYKSAGKARELQDFLNTYSKEGRSVSALEKFYKIAPDQYTRLTDESAAEAASQLRGLTGEGGIIKMIRDEINNLKGGGRDSDLQKGVRRRNEMFAGLTPSEGNKKGLDLFDSLFDGFSKEAKSKSGSKLKSLFSTLSETDKNEKLGDLAKQFQGLSVAQRISRIDEMVAKAKSGNGIEKIQSGSRNITVNITKLVETVNISKPFGRNSDSELVDAVKRALLTGVNDVNIVAQ